MSTLKVPVMELHLSGRVPEAVLRASARRLADALREVPGIAGVEKIGYRQREVRVLLDPERLQHLRISVDEIRRAIRRREDRARSSRQGCVSRRVKVPLPSIAYTRTASISDAREGNDMCSARM
jgi:multidrug efflux pump subunit AcrB